MRLKYPQIALVLFATAFLARPGLAQRISRDAKDTSRNGSDSRAGTAHLVAGPSQTFWITAGGGSWFDAANWSAGVPGATTYAQINNGGTAVSSSPSGYITVHNVILGFGSTDSGNLHFVYPLIESDGSITVGRAGRGDVDFTYVDLRNSGGMIAELPGSQGAVHLTHSHWSNTGDIIVGQSGSGTLDTPLFGSAGGGANAIIGGLPTGVGVVTIRNQSYFGGGRTLSVGRFGMGTLLLSDASDANGTTTFLGEFAGSNGVVLMDSYGRLNAGNLYVGGNTSGPGGTGLLRLKVNHGLGGRLNATTTVVWDNGTVGGTGTIAGSQLLVSTGGALLGGDATAASGALSIGTNLTLNSGSIIELVLGASGNHSSLQRTGGTWTFAPNQRFSFIDVGAQPGFYDNIITGLATDPGSTASWTIANTGFVGTFSYDGAGNIDLNLTSASGPALKLMSAVSRKTHGSAGDFDIPLPLTGEPGVECRAGGGVYKLLFTFNNEVVKGTAIVTSGKGTTSAGSTSFAGNTMTVNIADIADQQKVTVTLTNVVDSFSQVLPDTPVNMNVLVGDVSGNKSVNATDVSQARSQSGMVTSAVNFRADINISGLINASDVSQVKLHVGSGLP
jgi:T5SS/PEP-CTERM-associated repeat protein